MYRISKEIATPPIANPIGLLPNPIADKIKPKTQNNKTTRNNRPTQATDDKKKINDVPNSTKVDKEMMKPIVPILFFWLLFVVFLIC